MTIEETAALRGALLRLFLALDNPTPEELIKARAVLLKLATGLEC